MFAFLIFVALVAAILIGAAFVWVIKVKGDPDGSSGD